MCVCVCARVRARVFQFLHYIQKCIRKTFLPSIPHVGKGVIAIGLTTPIPSVRELMHDSASLRVLHKDGSCSRYGADVGCGKILMSLV